MTGRSKWLEQQGAVSRALLEAHEAERAPDEVRRNSLQSARVALLGSGFLTAIETTTKPALASSPETALGTATNAGTLGGAGLTSSLAVKLGALGLLLAAGATFGVSSFEQAAQGDAVSTSVEPTRAEDADPSAEQQPSHVIAKDHEQRQMRPVGELPSKSPQAPIVPAVEPSAIVPAVESGTASVEPSADPRAVEPSAVTPARKRSASAVAPKPVASSPPESHLTAELELIQRARHLLKSGQPEAAIRVLELYSTRHPKGALAPEAKLLREQATVRTP